MKKLTIYLATALMLTVTIPFTSIASTTPATTNTPIELAEVKALETRLKEIDEMDKSDLNRAEKKALRKEVRAIKADVNRLNGGGVYVSVGAIIIIIILLIILL